MAAQIRLASAPINWGIETPDGPDNPTAASLVENSAKAGYTGFELGPLRFLGTDPSGIAALLQQSNLDAVAYWLAVPLAQPYSPEVEREVREACETLKAVGAEHLLISDFGDEDRLAIVSRVDSFPDTWWTGEGWANVRASLERIAAIGQEYGIDISVHPHVGGHIESGAEIERMLEAIEGLPVTICIDTGHIRIGGIDSIPLMRRLGGRVTHIHAKDVEPTVLAEMQSGKISYFEAVGQGLYCDLGQGMIDWDGFAQAVDEIEFNGWVVAEEDRLLVPGSDAPYASNQANYIFLSKLLGIS